MIALLVIVIAVLLPVVAVSRLALNVLHDRRMK
jgi:hypothetical protein